MFENVDVSRLTRDYTKEPLKRKEIPSKQDLYYLYITQNLSQKEVSTVFGCGRDRICKYITYYGFVKSPELIKESMKRTTKKRFGVEYASQSKKFRESVLNTVRTKYGVDNISQAQVVKDKKASTCQTNYGVDNPSKSPEIQKRKRNTCLAHYGFESHTQSPVYQEKLRNTYMDKYGCYAYQQKHILHKDLWFNDEYFSNFVEVGFINSTGNREKYTTHKLCTYFNLTESNVAKRISKLNLWAYIKTEMCVTEQEVFDEICSLGFTPVKYRKDGLELDIFIPEKNFAIEFNGDYWHSTIRRTDSKYHYNKTVAAKARGITLYHLFENEWKNTRYKVLNQLRNCLGLNKEIIYARKCVVHSVTKEEASTFTNENHLRGNTSFKVCLGLYYDNVLVALMTFGKPRFDKKAQWELVRFCSKAGANVVGGASKLFKHFVRTYNPDSIVSYSEIAKTTGKIYETLGFKLDHISKPNYQWVRTRDSLVLSRYQCQLKKLLRNGFSNLGSTEDEIMSGRGFYKVYDCGNRVHIWECKR